MPPRSRIAQVVLALLGAGVVLIATRRDPVLSADSITYLSAADSLHGFGPYVDFTGEQLAHFPPVFPVLLAVGGRSLGWASIVGALGAAAAGALLFAILVSRVRWGVAVAGTVLYVLSQAVVTIESTVWSETPYCVLALATFVVLARRELTVARCTAAGVVAGFGFLTRYAGAGLVVSGLVMVLFTTAGGTRAHRLRCASGYVATSGSLAVAWMVRNLMATGRPLGPHFEGGADDSLSVLGERVTSSLGRLVVDIDSTGGMTRSAGTIALVGLLGAAAIAVARRPRRALDVGMAVFAITSIALPVASRAIAGTHIESRIMSPTMIPIVYFAVVGANALARNRHVDRSETRVRTLAVVGALVVAAVAVQGVVAAMQFPDRLVGSAGNVEQFSPELYATVADLPADAHVLTNNPWRIWWHTGRVPTSFAFTRPTPGNSHFPLSPSETVRAACEEESYLAWFPGLMNARDRAPEEVRPDLVDLVELTAVEEVRGGTLFALSAVEPDDCEQHPAP